MLQLTAAPGLVEWCNFTKDAKILIGDGWVNRNLTNCLMETYKNVRDADGDWRRVTHFTSAGYMGKDDRAYKLSEAFEGLLGEHLGSGAFGSVFECPWDSTKAIKIGCGHIGDGEIYGDGWLAYATYCLNFRKSGKYNPILPDIHQLYVSEGHDFFMALLERYDGTWNEEAGPEGSLTWRRYYTVRVGLMGEQHSCKIDSDYFRYTKELQADPEFPRITDTHGGNWMVYGTRVILNDPTGNSVVAYDKQKYNLRFMGVLPPDEIADQEYLESLKRAKHVIKRDTALRKHGMHRGWEPTKILPYGIGMMKVDSQGVAENVPFPKSPGDILSTSD